MSCRCGLLSAVVLAFGLRPAMAGPDPAELLRIAAERSQTAQYVAAAEVLERRIDGSAVVLQRVELKRQGAKHWTRYVSAPRPYQGAVMADDGRAAQVYLPGEKRLYQFEERHDTGHRPEGDHVRDRLDVTLVDADDPVAGRHAYHLSLTPKGRPAPKFDVWLDRETYVSLRREARFDGQRLWSRTSFLQVDYTPHLGANDFAFHPPRGTERVRVKTPKPGSPPAPEQALRLRSPEDLLQRAGVRVMQPRTEAVPDGFRLDAYLLHPPSPINVFHRRVTIRWVKGNSVIVLTQGPMSGRERGRGDRPDGPREFKPGVFFWVKDRIRLVLIGPREVDRDALRRCAESVDWYDADQGDRQD